MPIDHVDSGFLKLLTMTKRVECAKAFFHPIELGEQPDMARQRAHAESLRSVMNGVARRSSEIEGERSRFVTAEDAEVLVRGA